MDDSISRKQAVEAINKYGSVWMEYTEDMSVDEIAERALKASKQSMVKILHDLPSAHPERKKGKWVHVDTVVEENCEYPYGWMPWYCSECGVGVGKHQTAFCPNCGADMRGEQNENR